MKIKPCKVDPKSRSGSLIAITKAEITKRLGFAPNGIADVDFDKDKTVNCWMFQIADEYCQIRDYGCADDYKGTHGDANEYWSFQGNPDVMEYLFPGHVQDAMYTTHENVYAVSSGKNVRYVRTKFEAKVQSNNFKVINPKQKVRIVKVSIEELLAITNRFAT